MSGKTLKIIKIWPQSFSLDTVHILKKLCTATWWPFMDYTTSEPIGSSPRQQSVQARDAKNVNSRPH